MSVFAGCMDARNMIRIKEIDCPSCEKANGIEIYEKDGLTVGESSCIQCGYFIPDGVHLMKFIEEEEY